MRAHTSLLPYLFHHEVLRATKVDTLLAIALGAFAKERYLRGEMISSLVTSLHLANPLLNNNLCIPYPLCSCLALFLLAFSYSYISSLKALYPPTRSKCGALPLGVHLILLYFLRISILTPNFLMGWGGWMDGTRYQKCPSIFFILCGYIDHASLYLYIYIVNNCHQHTYGFENG